MISVLVLQEPNLHLDNTNTPNLKASDTIVNIVNITEKKRTFEKAHRNNAWRSYMANRRLMKEEQAATLNNLPQRALCADQPYQGVLCHLDLPGGSNQGTLTGQVLLIPRILTRVMIPRTMLTAKWQRQKPVLRDILTLNWRYLMAGHSELQSMLWKQLLPSLMQLV